MAVNIYASSSLDGIEAEELKLYNLVNQYRAENGLPAIPLSKALTTVANRHVLDLADNLGFLTHAWSDAAYDGNNPATWPNMWTAPQRFNTGYPGKGYENAFGGSGGYVATAADALNGPYGWKNSPLHNQVILNQGIWANRSWNALGIGIYKGYAVLWFGEEPDPTGTPTLAMAAPPIPSIPQPTPSSPTVAGEILIGSERDDSMVGSAGGDRLLGLGGNDLIAGNDGPDELYGNQGNDRITGDNGNDTIHGGQGSDNLLGNDGNDALYGNKGMDTLFGGNGNDLLFGGQDNDLLLGDAGNDTLKGDFGNDTLTGGPGTDVFVLTAGAGADTITDYDDAEDFLAFAGEAVPLNVVASGNNTLIQVASSGELLATLLGVAPSLITTSDFVPV